MDIILQKFAGKIDAKSLLSTVEELRVEYIDDGLTKEDVPPILGRLMMESVKFKKLPGPHKKKLVIAVLNHLIEEIDEGEKKSINLYAKSDVNVIFEKSKEQSISSRIKINDTLTAPIEKGQKCGEIIIELDGKVINRVDLIAAEDVKKSTYNLMLSKIFNSWIFK